MNTIRISAGSVSVEAELNSSPTAEAIWEKLPMEGNAKRWGDEIYIEIPVAMAQDADSRADVEVGELGYWPVGRAFCIFFGPTPVSVSQQPRAYSPVNILGNVVGDATAFRAVRGGERVTLSRGS